MTKHINLLFTSVGRRVFLMQTFREALAKLGLHGQVIGIDRSPLAPALQFVDAAHVVPAIDAEDYTDVLLDIVQRERATVVLPLIDPDVPVLARLRRQLAACGAAVAAVDESKLLAVADKWQTDSLLEKLNLNRPASWLPEQLEEIPREFPLFVKPRMGSASGDCFRVNDEEQLRFFTNYVPQAIIQEFLPGPEITNDVVCGLDGSVLSVVSRERIQVRGGEVAIGKTIHHAPIRDACVALARELAAKGPITIQCIMKNGTPHFTEINARLGGGAPYGTLAGADWPQRLVANIAGIDMGPEDRDSYRDNVVFSRFDYGVRVSAPDTSAQPRVTAAPAPATTVHAVPVRREAYVIGGGGHAKVVVSLLRTLGYRVHSMFDDDPRRWNQEVRGIPTTGPIERIASLPRRPAVIAVGNNLARRRLAERFDLDWLTAVHPSAIVDESVVLGRGTVVMAGVILQADATVGDHVIINTNASVDHDCVVGGFSHIAPGARLAGHVKLGSSVLFGVGAVTIPGVKVGDRTIVGAGSTVARDLPADVIAKGVPAVARPLAESDTLITSQTSRSR